MVEEYVISVKRVQKRVVCLSVHVCGCMGMHVCVHVCMHVCHMCMCVGVDLDQAHCFLQIPFLLISVRVL